MRRYARLMEAAAGSRAPEVRYSVRLALVASVLAVATLTALIATLAAVVGDAAAGQTPGARSWWLLGSVAVLLTGEQALRTVEMKRGYDRFPPIVEELRLRVGRHLRRIPMQELRSLRTGRLAELLSGTVAAAVQGLSVFGSLVLEQLVVPVALLAVVFVVDWRLGLVLLATVPAAVPLARRIRRVWGSGHAATGDADSDAAARVVEYVDGLAEFRATGQVGDRARALVEALDRQEHALAERYRRLSGPATWTAGIVQLGVTALVAVGAVLVVGSDLAVGSFVAVVVVAIRFADPLASLAVSAGVFEQTDVALRRIAEVLAVRPLPEPRHPHRPDGSAITFDGVGFTYAGRAAPALRDVSFTARERAVTAVVGTSGSGKTTVLRLVTRWADPQHGRVRLGGVDLRDMTPSELAARICVVFQDDLLFDDTVAANIRVGRPEATDAAVRAATDAIGATAFVDALPLGFATRVGEHGALLSGGERQRISIARAIVSDAPVVLLDEPTAALDGVSEAAVQDALDVICRSRTVLVVAHRLSTVRAADRIVVLDDGGLVEEGTHAGLLAADGRYAALWAAQREGRRWRVRGGGGAG